MATFLLSIPALLISVLVAAGSYSILPVWLFLCRLWLNDPLRSIGAFFPFLAFAGTLAAWRRIGWSMNGTFWGLPLLTLSILLAPITTSLTLVYSFHQQNQPVLHPGLVMFFYGAGAVLLFGGPRLLRVSIAPLSLLLLFNPVPAFFNAAVDLPLQYLSATTARHFAHLIGLQPTGEQLRMMFSPTFGMMIVPGCNGVRGSITLGYLALIFGYTRHLRLRALAFTTLAAFLLGYALNLLRLCVLVAYYRIGLNFPSIQKYGAGVDYAIGCTLFLFAALALGLIIRKIEPKPHEPAAIVEARSSIPSDRRPGYAIAARGCCFLILTLAFIVPKLGRSNSIHVMLPNEQAVLSSFPSQVGSYRLSRTYAEHDYDGLARLAMADYSTSPDPAGATSKITLGLYMGPDMHLVAFSRYVQGITPALTGAFDAVDAGALKVHFIATLYDDGISREYDAESFCYETGCSASLESSPKRLFLSSSTFSNIIFSPRGKRLTILLRRECLDSDSRPNKILRSQFEADARQFMEQLNLRALLQEDGIPM